MNKIHWISSNEFNRLYKSLKEIGLHCSYPNEKELLKLLSRIDIKVMRSTGIEKVKESLKIIEGICCPFCKGKNLQIYMAFRYCYDCDRNFDYSDIVKQEVKKRNDS